MAVTAIKDYAFESPSAQQHFHGNQLLYVGWEDHLMFCAPYCFPLPPDMPFGALKDQVLAGPFSYHPDWAKIDWERVEWLKSGQPFHPDPARSLAENGLKHKDVIRLRTPGLTGIKGSCA